MVTQMRQIYKIIVATRFVLYLVVFSLLCFPFLSYAQTSNPEIRIFFKGGDEAAPKKYNLTQGEALITGSKIQILIDRLEPGNYELLLEVAGKDKTTLVDKIKAKKNTKVYIPSTHDWITLSNKVGDYKLILADKDKNQIAQEFQFILLPASKNVVAAGNNFENHISLNLTHDFFLSEETPQVINQFFRISEYIYDKQKPSPTRGFGANIYENNASSVVYILNIQNKKVAGNGSGVIINKQGDIITNHHVIEGADELAVFLRPESGIMSKEVVESNTYKANTIKFSPQKDLALIRITSPPENLTIANLGFNRLLRVGEDVHAIGHPAGSPWVYTTGTISQIWPNYKWAYKKNTHTATVIQTQTPINPGNSGGPLLTDNGDVIGLNTFINIKLQNTNFAVSVDEIRQFIEADDHLVTPEGTNRNKKNKSNLVLLHDADFNKNGVADAFVYDSDGDGRPNLLVSDQDEDKKNLRYFLSTGQDGFWDTEVIEKKFARVYIIDKDKDGRADVTGYDYDKDGTIDKYQKMNG
jgi:S1-C subfamily serine protease